MAEFKLSIGDKTGKTEQIVVSGDNANSLIGKKIGDKIKGESLDLPGYEFEITGGADYCGFPMRKDVDGPVRKKILLVTGVGIRNKEKGIKRRKTVCGNTIHERITQVSMKIIKKGRKPLTEAPAKEDKEEKPAQKPVEKPVEEKAEPKKEKPAEKTEPKEDKPTEKPEEKPVKEKAEPKEEKPKEEKPVEKLKPKEEKLAEEAKEEKPKDDKPAQKPKEEKPEKKPKEDKPKEGKSKEVKPKKEKQKPKKSK